MSDPQSLNITNILQADPMVVSVWCGAHLLDVKIPEPGPNTAYSTIAPELKALLAKVPNRLALATEYYGVVTAALANQRVAKKLSSKNVDVESTISILTAIQDIFYRCIQALQSLYDGASRMITVEDHQMKMGQH